MLFVALITMTVGYAMMYASLHGNWEFWKYLIPAQQPAAMPAPSAPVTPTGPQG